MKGDTFKYAYSLMTLTATVMWAGFCVWITYMAVMQTLPLEIIAAAGANVVLGVLLKNLGDQNQYWFRKAKPPEAR